MTGAQVAERLAAVRERIELAAARAGRDPARVRLVAVTKEVPAELVRAAVEAGATDLGENRAQELSSKLDALDGVNARWHFIGTLQRNKVRIVVGRVVLVHSVDSVELGRSIGRRSAANGMVQDVLIEVNVSGEATKSGVAVRDALATVEALEDEAGVLVRGLMTIAPPGEPQQARACFRALRELRDELAARFSGVTELSMGMTSDFEEAVEEGATIVRVGTAIFGARP
jgi:pyridoxal phosphate enzyme (YggS family)